MEVSSGTATITSYSSSAQLALQERSHFFIAPHKKISRDTELLVFTLHLPREKTPDSPCCDMCHVSNAVSPGQETPEIG